MRNPLSIKWPFIAAALCIPWSAQGALELVKVWPAVGEVPADAPLRIVFNGPPVVGNHGRVIVSRAMDRTEVASIDLAAAGGVTSDFGGRTLHYQPVIVDGNTASIRLPTHAIKAGETYFVRVEPGVFQDASGAAWGGINDDVRWRFQTKHEPAAAPDRIVVAADGDADFCTVQGAVDAVPVDRLTSTRIFIRRGVYDGIVRVPVGKNHLHLEGEDRRGVLLAGTNNDQLNKGVSARALIGVEADDFALENVAVRNLTPYQGSQAEAFHVRGERCILRHADFYSFQDTLHLDGRIYVEDCTVEGNVDFIWGAGSAFFEQCEIHSVHGGCCVQARNAPGTPGYIFDHCRVTGTMGDPSTYLARIDPTRFPGSQVVFLHCAMDQHVKPEGWQLNAKLTGELHFEEFGSTDLLGHPLDETRRLAGSKQLSAAEAAALGTPVAVLGGYGRWNPQAADAKAEANVFDVRQFGAKGDGVSPENAAIQKALDAAGAAGGGIVRVPAGNYVTRPLFLRAHVTLHLDEGAVLRSTDVPADFGIGANNTPEGKVVGLINGTNLVDVAVTGRGTVDGAGQRWWQEVRAAAAAKQPEPRRPRLVCLNGCRGVTVEGVTLKNSPMFHLVPSDCEDVVIRGLTITAPTDSPNTDGIDPSASRRVSITDCRIDTGDDNIAIKSGHVDPAHPGAACANFVITNCAFLHGHGMSIGSETLGGVSDVFVQNCTFENTRSGFRIKSARGRGGNVQNIRISDVQMTNVEMAINVTCYYPKVPDEDAAKPVAVDTPVFHGIEIVNFKAAGSRDAGVIVGLPESPIMDFSMENVHITAKTGFAMRNVGSIHLSNVEIIPFAADGQ